MMNNYFVTKKDLDEMRENITADVLERLTPEVLKELIEKLGHK